MSQSDEFALFHDDPDIAIEIAKLLTEERSAAINRKASANSRRLAAAIIELGVEEFVTAEITVNDGRTGSREPPDFLLDKPSVTMETGYRRGRSQEGIPNPTTELPFVNWVIMKAADNALDQTRQLLQTELDAATGLQPEIRSIRPKNGFPPDLRWIVVNYLIDDSGSRTTSAVPTPPMVAFERLDEILPTTVNGIVESDSETIIVENIPIIAHKKYVD